MANEQELRDELFERTTSIERVIYELDKAKLVLDHWTGEYSFCETPDPRAAIAWGRSCGSQDTHQLQSATWFMEYEKIFQFILIASDYVYESQKILKAAIERSGDNE